MEDKNERQNCWEFKKCGREPDGFNAVELGVCRATTETQVNGVNGGKNGGRVCWAVTGTLYGGQVQGSFASKISSCRECEFYKQVRMEEGEKENITRNVRKLLMPSIVLEIGEGESSQ